MKKTIVTICLLSLFFVASCGPAEPETSINVTGTVDTIYYYTSTVTINGVSEEFQFGTVIVLEDGTSYRILGTHEFMIGELCDLQLEPFENGWYLVK